MRATEAPPGFLRRRLPPIGRFVGEVEQHPQLDQPTDHVRTVHHHLRDEFPFGTEMTGPQSFLEVQLRRVVCTDRRLDAAFGHHRIAVAEPQLGGKDHLGALARRNQRRRAAGPAAADDQHVGAD